MKATAKLDKLKSETCKDIIIRNLSRIMDIRILDIDLENNTLSFVYENSAIIEKVKRELGSIGYPLKRLIKYEPQTEPTF